MIATSKRAQQVVLVVLGLLMFATHVYPLVTYFLSDVRPTAGTVAPMFWTIVATLGLLACRATIAQEDGSRG